MGRHAIPIDHLERAHLTQCCTGILPLRPAAGCSPPSNSEVKNEWSLTSTLHGFMSCTTKTLCFTLQFSFTCSMGWWIDSTANWNCHMRPQCVEVAKLYNPLSSFCCIEFSFCCSAVFRIVAINWQIFDDVEKGENRNPYTVATRVKVFFAMTGGFMLINVTKFWESLAGWYWGWCRNLPPPGAVLHFSWHCLYNSLVRTKI